MPEPKILAGRRTTMLAVRFDSRAACRGIGAGSSRALSAFHLFTAAGMQYYTQTCRVRRSPSEKELGITLPRSARHRGRHRFALRAWA